MDPADRIRALIAAHLGLRAEGRSPTLESLIMRAWGEAQGHGYSLGFRDGERAAGSSDTALADCWSKLAARETQGSQLTAALATAEAEAARLRAALEQIKRECGAVCPEFETCAHSWCASSCGAYLIAAAALRGQDAPPADEEGAQGAIGGGGGE